MASAPMDWDSPSAPYKLLYDVNSERKSIIIYTTPTEKNSYYGIADFNLLEPMWRDVLKFNVVEIRDPSVHELDHELNGIVNEINNRAHKHDQIAITFVGHGGCHEIVGPDGRTYRHEFIRLRDGSVTIEEIQKKFYSSSCWGLAGKPKHLYGAFCRGNYLERPVGFAAHREEGQKDHFFTFYSTSEQNVSLFNFDTGSCFVQALVSVFRRDYQIKPLVSLANTVIEELPTFLPQGYVQNPQIVSNIRDLYFGGEKAERFHHTSLPTYSGDLPLQQLTQGFSYANDLSVVRQGGHTAGAPAGLSRPSGAIAAQPSGIWVELSARGEVQGRVNIHLDYTKHDWVKDIPLQALVQGLVGGTCEDWWGSLNIPTTSGVGVGGLGAALADTGRFSTRPGDVVCLCIGSRITGMAIVVKDGGSWYSSLGFAVIGRVVAGLDVARTCKAIADDDDNAVTVSGSGLLGPGQ